MKLRLSSPEGGSANRCHNGVAVEELRGLSSAGRAVALQASGRRFDPDRLHHSRSVVGSYTSFGDTVSD